MTTTMMMKTRTNAKLFQPTLWTDFLACVPEGNNEIVTRITNIANVTQQRLINSSRFIFLYWILYPVPRANSSSVSPYQKLTQCSCIYNTLMIRTSTLGEGGLWIELNICETVGGGLLVTGAPIWSTANVFRRRSLFVPWGTNFHASEKARAKQLETSSLWVYLSLLMALTESVCVNDYSRYGPRIAF